MTRFATTLRLGAAGTAVAVAAFVSVTPAEAAPAPAPAAPIISLPAAPISSAPAAPILPAPAAPISPVPQDIFSDLFVGFFQFVNQVGGLAGSFIGAIISFFFSILGPYNT